MPLCGYEQQGIVHKAPPLIFVEALQTRQNARENASLAPDDNVGNDCPLRGSLINDSGDFVNDRPRPRVMRLKQPHGGKQLRFRYRRMPRFDGPQHELARPGKLVLQSIDVNGGVVKQLGGLCSDTFKKIQLRVGSSLKWPDVFLWLVTPQATPQLRTQDPPQDRSYLAGKAASRRSHLPQRYSRARPRSNPYPI